ARNVLMIFVQRRAIDSRTIWHKARASVSLVPEITKGTMLELLKEQFVLIREFMGDRPSLKRMEG
ncbi:MAG: hypothetical protein M3R67_12615, partial [Acidobacteriota bacterium]|nr:hypothetical protein [Acidobacteriota bacterium]